MNVRLRPVNKRYLVRKIKETKKESLVLVPEETKELDNDKVICVVVDRSSDCEQEIRLKDFVAVEKHALEKTLAGGTEFFTVREQYVVGVIKGIEEV